MQILVVGLLDQNYKVINSSQVIWEGLCKLYFEVFIWHQLPSSLDFLFSHNDCLAIHASHEVIREWNRILAESPALVDRVNARGRNRCLQQFHRHRISGMAFALATLRKNHDESFISFWRIFFGGTWHNNACGHHFERLFHFFDEELCEFICADLMGLQSVRIFFPEMAIFFFQMNAKERNFAPKVQMDSAKSIFFPNTIAFLDRA